MWSNLGSALSGGFTSTGRSLLLGAVGAKEDRQAQRRAQRHQTGEREAAEVFSAQQAALQRDWSGGESQLDRDFQSAEAGLARAFSAEQAQQQMDFQERMASTQVQRATEDLQRAGLNRILALGQPSAAPSGAMAQAATPSGSRGSGSSASSSGGGAGPAPTGNMAAMLQAATQMQTAQSLVKKQEAEADYIDAQTDKTKADTGFSELKGLLGNFLKEYLGGEGTVGKQIHGAIRPLVDKAFELDRGLQRKLGEAESGLREKARDKITTIRINRGNDAHKHNRRQQQ